jgi:hypothetical protein
MKAVYTDIWKNLPVVAPYGGATLKEGGTANGPMGPKVAK